MLKTGDLKVSNKIKKVSIEKQVIPLSCVLLSFNNIWKVLCLFLRNKTNHCVNIVVLNIVLFLSQERKSSQIQS